MALSTANLMMNYEQLSEVSNTPETLGLVVKYGSIEYRGQEVQFLSDPMGVQCFAQWDGELVDLGLNNIYYKEDMCRFIDQRLDLITDFRNCPNFVGAKLEYFRNGEFRDIRLCYKGRIIKVYLIAGDDLDVNIPYLIEDAQRVLCKLVLTEIDAISES